VTDFLETRSGELWVGTSGGLVHFDPKGTPANRVSVNNGSRGGPSPMFRVILPEDEDRRARAVNVLLEARDGTVWCGTRKHLYRVNRLDGRYTLVPTDIGLSGEPPGAREVVDLLEAGRRTRWGASLGSPRCR